MRLKETHPLIKSPEHLPPMSPYDRRQLKQIAHHKHLYPSKWFMGVALDTPHSKINCIQNICSQHAYLIDNQQIDGSYHLVPRHIQLMSFGQSVLGIKIGIAGEVPFGLTARQKTLQRKQKLRMNSYTFGM